MTRSMILQPEKYACLSTRLGSAMGAVSACYVVLGNYPVRKRRVPFSKSAMGPLFPSYKFFASHRSKGLLFHTTQLYKTSTDKSPIPTTNPPQPSKELTSYSPHPSIQHRYHPFATQRHQKTSTKNYHIAQSENERLYPRSK